MVRPWRGGITNLHQCIPRSPGPLSPAWHRARVGALCRLRCLGRGLRQTRDRFGVECSSGLCEDKTSRSGCGGASMQNRPARARSRLARLMDRPRAECNTIINFASPSDNPSLAVLAALLPAIGSPIRLANARAEIGAIDLDFALQLVAADHRSHSLAQFVQRAENRLGPTFMFRGICRAETPLTPL